MSRQNRKKDNDDFKFVRAYGSDHESDISTEDESESVESVESVESDYENGDLLVTKDDITQALKRNKEAETATKDMSDTESDTKTKISLNTNNIPENLEQALRTYVRPIYNNRLYIGNYGCLTNEKVLNDLKISTIISLSKRPPPSTDDYKNMMGADIFMYHYDNLGTNFINYSGFNLMLKLVTRSLSKGKPVLLQCENGTGNSAVFALFCLSVLDNGLTLEQKFQWFKKKVPEIQLDSHPEIRARVLQNIDKIYNEYTDEKNYNKYCNDLLKNI